MRTGNLLDYMPKYTPHDDEIMALACAVALEKSEREKAEKDAANATWRAASADEKAERDVSDIKAALRRANKRLSGLFYRRVRLRDAVLALIGRRGGEDAETAIDRWLRWHPFASRQTKDCLASIRRNRDCILEREDE